MAVPVHKHTKSRNGCVTCKARRRKCDEGRPSCAQCARRRITCGGYSKELRWKEFEQFELSSNSVQKNALNAASLSSKRTKPSMTGRELASSMHASQRKEKARGTRTELGIPSPIQRDLGFHAHQMSRLEMDMLTDNTTDRLVTSGLPSTKTHVTTGVISASSQSPPPRESGIVSNDEDINMQPSFLQLFYGTGDLDLATTNTLEDIDMHAHLDTDTLGLVSEEESEWWMPPEPAPTVREESSPAPTYGGLAYSLHSHPRLQSGSPEHIAFLFNQRICEVLCIRDGSAGNPWRRIVWPLAQDNVTLYHAIAAMTFFQDANRLPHFRSKGVQHLNTSIQQFYGTHGNNRASLRLEVALAVTLVLGFAQTWYYPRSSTGIRFVKSAKSLLKKALASYRTATRTSDTPPESSTRQYGNMDFDCLRLLTNTWIYMDVITRFTCRNTRMMDTQFMAACRQLDPHPHTTLYIDPLMGVATTLFPLIGRVADLVSRVHTRATQSTPEYEELNPPGLVAEAVELKVAIEHWTPFSLAGVDANYLHTPGMPESVESMTSASASDLIQTANAYKWATILLLYQAVPELPRPFSVKQLARRVLVLLATVPLGSRAIIFPVLPLLISGCEATEKDDRDWVRSRWRALATGNSSGIVDRCLEITLEVWRRRDHDAKQSYQQWNRYSEQNTPQERIFHGSPSTALLASETVATWPTDDASGISEATPLISETFGFEQEPGLNISGNASLDYTVRSKQHWLSVMCDWGWEVMLG